MEGVRGGGTWRGYAEGVRGGGMQRGYMKGTWRGYAEGVRGGGTQRGYALPIATIDLVGDNREFEVSGTF